MTAKDYEFDYLYRMNCEHEFEDGVCIWCGEEYVEEEDEFYYYEDDVQKEIEKEEDK